MLASIAGREQTRTLLRAKVQLIPQSSKFFVGKMRLSQSHGACINGWAEHLRQQVRMPGVAQKKDQGTLNVDNQQFKS